MTKCTLCVILLLTLPAFATITDVQSNAKWTCSGSGSSIICTVTLAQTTNHNLLAVWTFWQSTFPYTASVGDSNPLNAFPSAVGPTLQSVSNTSAQIFYAANIHPSSGGDTVTVTFACPSTNPACTSPTITSGGVVAVEYSGLDQNYPLDSVSAGYSTSGNATSLLDSGTVAPANSNLLVFGGGTTDTGTASALSPPWTTIQNHSGSVTEQMIVTGNNALQRATASSTSTGNWVMQMAVFRDAYWTVAGGWRPARVGKLLYADQFPGGDIGGQINTAITQLPTVGGVPAGVVSLEGYSGIVTLSTPIVLNSHFVSLVGPGRE